MVGYLIIRSFIKYAEEEVGSTPGPKQEKGSKITSKGVSKKVGEYVEYEEVNKNKT